MDVHSLPCCLAASELDSARQNETLSAGELGFDMKKRGEIANHKEKIRKVYAHWSPMKTTLP